jgi:L-serine/L-threonine ammonia-lyase
MSSSILIFKPTGRQMSVVVGRTVWLKLDVLQPPGVFQDQGIRCACATYKVQGAQRFVSSGGNAWLAVAYVR